MRPHYQDMESNQLYLIHRNTHREAAKMRRQRNLAQMKVQIKTAEKDLNKMEISNLSDAEFKTLVIRVLKELSEDLNSTKKTQSEMKVTLTEIKNNLYFRPRWSCRETHCASSHNHKKDNNNLKTKNNQN